MWASFNLKDIFGSKQKKQIELWKEWKTKPGRQLMFDNELEINDQFAAACQKDLTAEFGQAIQYAIENDENIIAMLEAPQGEGKSLIAQAVMVDWVSSFLKIKKRKVNFYFTFNQAETQNLLPKTQDGVILCQDENTALIGRGSNTAETELQNLIETMRFTQKSIIICSPKITLLPGMNLLLRPFGKFRKYDETHKDTDMKSRVLWYQLREDPGRGIKFIPLGYVIMELNSTKGVQKKYLEAKRKNYRRLESNNGGSTSQSKEELKRWQKQAKKILKVALKDGWPASPDQPSRKALTRYFMQLEISCSNQQEDFLKGEVVRFYQKGLFQKTKTKKDNTPSTQHTQITQTEFTVNYEEILTEIISERKDENIARDIDIYRASKDPLRTAEEFILKYNITATRISQIKKSVEGKVSEKIGNRFELFLEPFLKVIYDSVEHYGGIGQPDYVCRKDNLTIIYSIKCFSFVRNSYSIPYKESRAEIEFARKIKHEKPTVICYCFNLENKKIYEHMFDADVVQISTPYTSRNITINLDKFTRDPSSDPWVIISKGEVTK